MTAALSAPDILSMSADEAREVLAAREKSMADFREIVSAKLMLEDPDAPRAPEWQLPDDFQEDPEVAAMFDALQAGREEDSEAAVAHIAHQIASRIMPSKPQWLWRGWLVQNALNLLVGRQGSGKTTFLAHIVAALTTDIPLPGDTAHDPITCGILSLEEPADRVVARLTAAGADLDRVQVLGDVEDFDDKGKPFTRRWSLPGDISILGKLIRQLRLSLVAVDGLGYSISGDSHNYAIVGSALAALAAEAARSGAAILGLVHPPKGASDPVTAAIGSTAWTAIPRISIVLGVDPSDDSGQRRLVRVGKSNYKTPESGLSFAIDDDAELEVGFVTAIRKDDTPAEDIVGAPASSEEKGERAEARDVLRALLAEGPMDGAEVVKASGINPASLKRARKDLGVVAQARRDQRGRVVGWIWFLPEDQRFTPCTPGTSGSEDQRFNPGRLSAPCAPGTSGLHQDKYPPSLPEAQGSGSSTPGPRSDETPPLDADLDGLFAAEDGERIS